MKSLVAKNNEEGWSTFIQVVDRSPIYSISIKAVLVCVFFGFSLSSFLFSLKIGSDVCRYTRQLLSPEVFLSRIVAIIPRDLTNLSICCASTDEDVENSTVPSLLTDPSVSIKPRSNSYLCSIVPVK